VVLEASWAVLDRLGSEKIIISDIDDSVTLLGRSCAPLGASWGILGASWGGLVPSWGPLGAVLDLLESNKKTVISNIADSVTLLGRSGAPLGASWGISGASWGGFGSIGKRTKAIIYDIYIYIR